MAAIEHRTPDRVPTDYWAHKPVTERLCAALGVDDYESMLTALGVDIRDVRNRITYTGPPEHFLPDGRQCDMWGVPLNPGGTYASSVTRTPLSRATTVAEIDAHTPFPNPDWWDYSVIPAQLEGKEDWVVRGGSYEEFAAFKFLRGVEQGYLDLAMHPEIVHYCMDNLCRLRCEDARRIYEQIPGKVIWTWVAEDVGSQEGLMISLAHIKEFLAPYMRRMADVVHEGGAYAFHHSDGCGRDALPTMIEQVGIDVLEPVQWRCPGMERETLKELFGEDIAFMGGMDNQITLVRGTIEEIKQEVEDNIRILGAGGGYLLGPCHNIQIVTAPEKVVAMYDHAYECGRMA
ncbi:MAG TPA: uroporphyrinogen-III decarboxylase-like protein [Armatimonadetes bacterium]|nr:uroporphyrinogen-III decarboxylase-like protein [Armatimonadota bacterium]